MTSDAKMQQTHTGHQITLYVKIWSKVSFLEFLRAGSTDFHEALNHEDLRKASEKNPNLRKISSSDEI